MNMYVFQGVLRDYTSGVVLIAAEDLMEAQVIAYEKYNCRIGDSLADFLERQGGFTRAAGVYPLAPGVNKGVLHSVLRRWLR